MFFLKMYLVLMEIHTMYGIEIKTEGYNVDSTPLEVDKTTTNYAL